MKMRPSSSTERLKPKEVPALGKAAQLLEEEQVRRDYEVTEENSSRDQSNKSYSQSLNSSGGWVLPKKLDTLNQYTQRARSPLVRPRDGSKVASPVAGGEQPVRFGSIKRDERVLPAMGAWAKEESHVAIIKKMDSFKAKAHLKPHIQDFSNVALSPTLEPRSVMPFSNVALSPTSEPRSVMPQTTMHEVLLICRKLVFLKESKIGLLPKLSTAGKTLFLYCAQKSHSQKNQLPAYKEHLRRPRC
jgi:hypothetical protein